MKDESLMVSEGKTSDTIYDNDQVSQNDDTPLNENSYIDIEVKDFSNYLEEFKVTTKLIDDLYSKSLKDYFGYVVRLILTMLTGLCIAAWAFFTKHPSFRPVLIMVAILTLFIGTKDDIVLRYNFKNVLWYRKKDIENIYLAVVTEKVKSKNGKCFLLDDKYYVDLYDASEYSEVSIGEVIIIATRGDEFHVISTEEFLGVPKQDRTFKEWMK